MFTTNSKKLTIRILLVKYKREEIRVLSPYRLSDTSTGYINQPMGPYGMDAETENDSKWPLDRLFGRAEESLLNELRKIVKTVSIT